MFNGIYSSHPNLFLQLALPTLSPTCSHLYGSSSSITWNFPCLKYAVLAMPNLPGFCKARSSWRTLLGNPTGNCRISWTVNKIGHFCIIKCIQCNYNNQRNEKNTVKNREGEQAINSKCEVLFPHKRMPSSGHPFWQKKQTLNWTQFLSYN